MFRKKDGLKNPVLLEYARDQSYLYYLNHGRAILFPGRFVYNFLLVLFCLAAFFSLIIDIVNLLDYAMRINDIKITGTQTEKIPALQNGILLLAVCTFLLIVSCVLLYKKMYAAFLVLALLSCGILLVHFMQQSMETGSNIGNLWDLMLRHLIPLCIIILSAIFLYLIQYFYKKTENRIYKKELRQLYLENAEEGEILSKQQWERIFDDLEAELYGRSLAGKTD